MTENTAIISCYGRYTKFFYKGRTITFLHGKDLIKYIRIKECLNGYIVADCLGKIKGEYEDYIDLPYFLEQLYISPSEYLSGMEKVVIRND